MKTKYYTITDVLETLLKTYSDAQKKQISEMLEFHIDQYKQLRKKNKGFQVAYNYQQHLQREIDKQTKKEPKISCRKGCSYCCMINVDISEDEADLILEFCKEKKIAVDKELLTRQSKYNVENWTTQKREDMACVFLKDKQCSIYEVRPYGCRKYFSLDDPNKCKSYEKVQAIKRFVCSPKIEIITSAIMSSVKFDSMPKMLLKKLT